MTEKRRARRSQRSTESLLPLTNSVATVIGVVFLLLIAPELSQAQESFVDTVYVDTVRVPPADIDPGDTIWVGVGFVNTFAVGGASFRLELEDTSRITPIFALDSISGTYHVLTRLVGRGLAFDKPAGVAIAQISNPNAVDVITGVIVDFDGVAVIASGRGTILQLACAVKPGVQSGDSTLVRVADDLSDPIAPRNNLSDSAGMMAVYPQLRNGLVLYGAGVGPVILNLQTDTGNDTLVVGHPGSIIFSAHANGNQVKGMVWPFEVIYTGGNWIGTIQDSESADFNGLDTNVFHSPSVLAGFSLSHNLSPFYGMGTDPDTLLAGYISGGGPWTISDEVFRINVTPSGPGTVRFDSVPAPGLPPANVLSVQAPTGANLPIVWLGDGKTIHSVLPPAIEMAIEGTCPVWGVTYEGGGIAIHVSTLVNQGALESLDLTSMAKDGIPATSIVPPIRTGLDLVDVPDASELIMYWVPQSGEAGTWEFCFQATNENGDTGLICDTVDVLAKTVDHFEWIPQHIEPEMGVPISIDLVCRITHNTDLQGIVMPMELVTISGGAFFDAPILEPAGDFTGDMSVGPDFAAFASKSANTYSNDAVSPDSVLGGLISFGAALQAPGVHDAMTLKSTIAPVEGIFRLLSPDGVGFPPASGLSYNAPPGGSIIPSESPGCFPVTFVRNVPPIVSCPLADYGAVAFGQTVSVSGFTCDDPDDGPGPYAFSVASATKDGLPAVPTTAPTFLGDTFQWQTSNTDLSDVGLWTFCIQCNDGLDNSSNPCCFTVNVVSEVALPCFRFDCVPDALTGSDVCVPLYIDNTDPCKVLGGFDLLFTYDPTLLTFTGLDLAGSVLESSGWEYLTYRIVSTNPAKVRIVAIADMNNSNQHPNDLCLNGALANVCFRVTSDQNAGCQSALIQFCWDDCGDNTASSPDGNSLYVITDPNGPVPWAGGDPNAGIVGGGIIATSCGVDAQLATFEGGITGPADYPCDNPDPTKPDREECLYFVNGKVKIICPGDIDDRGDLNLNGLAYEIADAVLYSNYFIQGPGVFAPGIHGQAQVAASDINADGTPLTVADLVYLIRVITGDVVPIPGDILGGGPKVAAGTLEVSLEQSGRTITVMSTSDHRLGAALLIFRTHGAVVEEVTLGDLAADMGLGHGFVDGEFRVLIHDIETRESVASGAGTLLSILIDQPRGIELVSVEAATFMGDPLQTALSGKVLPTAFALHQNFPNPFNPSTSLNIDFPAATDYDLTIYNISGQVVKTFSGQAEAGTLTITWDGRDRRGSEVASGAYFYRLDTAAYKDTKTMVLVR